MANSIQASPTPVAMRLFGLGAFGAFGSVSWVFALLVGMTAWLHTPALHAQPPARYVAVEYARLANPGVATVIRNMNATHEVAGAFQTTPRKASSALIFLANHGLEDVAGEQGAGNSVAYGINDQGEIAGAYNTSTAQRPFHAVRGLGFQELALPTGSNGGIAYAINETGEAAGYVSGTAGIRPVWWTRRGEVQLLQSPGNLTAQALDLNDRGDMVGVSGGEPKAAVLWPRKGGIVSLGTLPGFTHSEAVAVSENGSIAGVATGVADFPNRSRAVLWQAGGLAIQDLGALAGGADSRARDVNNRGEVVGTSTSAQGSRAFIWTASTGMRDLNVLVNVPGLVMTEALSVNKQGDIVVMGHDAAPDAHEKADGHEHEHGHEDHHAARRIFVLRSRE
jgi:probable HAF family extracellular repeat protein